MRESTDRGACIRIDGMVPHVFSALLHFIYTDSLPEITREEEVLMAQRLMEAADRYDMQRLKLICEEKLCKYLDANTAATTLVLADQHHSHRLKVACIEFLKSPQALDVVVATDETEARRELADADAVYGRVDRDLLAGATKLRWIQSPAIGLERTMYPELVAHP